MYTNHQTCKYVDIVVKYEFHFEGLYKTKLFCKWIQLEYELSSEDVLYLFFA